MVNLNTYFDKIFYINLQDDVDRNNHILQEFEKWDITNFERVEGKKLITIPDRALWRNFNRNQLNDKYILGSLGTRETHLSIILTAAQRQYSRILILEDDIFFTQDPHLLLNQNINILNDWDILYFGGQVEHHFRNQIVGAYAYAVSSKIFDDIYILGHSSGMEIDNFYAKILQHMSYNYNQSGKYNIRTVEPFNIVQVNYGFDSNIR